MFLLALNVLKSTVKTVTDANNAVVVAEYVVMLILQHSFVTCMFLLYYVIMIP